VSVALRGLWAIYWLCGDDSSAEVARRLLWREKFDGKVSVRSGSVDGSGMHVAGGLKPQLTVDNFLLGVRLAGSLNGNLRIAHRDANGIDVVFVQQDGIVRRDIHGVHVHLLIMKGPMMMRFRVEGYDTLLLRSAQERKE